MTKTIWLITGKKLYVLILNLLLFFTLGQMVVAAERPPMDAKQYLQLLKDDLRHYKNTSPHRGHLYEHSMWAEQYVSLWGSPRGFFVHWMDEFSSKERVLISLSALLHDIGKAGDADYEKNSVPEERFKREGDDVYYFLKLNHEKIGFDYVAHDIKDAEKYQGYKFIDQKPYSFNALFNMFSFSEEEQKIVAVLIGCHKGFSSVVAGRMKETEYLKQIRDLAAEIGLIVADVIFFRKIVAMAVVVGAADFMATYHPIEFPCGSLIDGNCELCLQKDCFVSLAWTDRELSEKIPQFEANFEPARANIFKELGF